jgi:hypothetical protein
MNHVSLKETSVTLLRSALLLAAVALSACSYLMPQPPPKPARLQKPAAPVDTQQKDRARQALQKATSSSNEYSACVMFSTSTHRGNNIAASDVATAASANCAPKLDDYEQGMTAYYEANPIKPSNATASSSKDRAHERRVELEQTTREAAIRSLGKTN